MRSDRTVDIGARDVGRGLEGNISCRDFYNVERKPPDAAVHAGVKRRERFLSLSTAVVDDDDDDDDDDDEDDEDDDNDEDDTRSRGHTVVSPLIPGLSPVSAGQMY